MHILAIVLASGFIAGLVRFIFGVIGIGVVSYLGFDQLLTYTVSLVHSSMGSIPASVAGLAGLSGVDVAINLILAGITVRVSTMALKRFKIL